jgi:hypothetical protein
MNKALKTGACICALALVFAGCSNPTSSGKKTPAGQATVRTGQELQTALTDSKITDIVIAASFNSNVSAIVASPKTITIPQGYQVLIDALQVESDITLANSGKPSNAAGNLGAAGILMVYSKFMVCEEASFSVAGAAELAFGPAVTAGNAWIDGEFSSAAAGSIYRYQLGDLSADLSFGGSGSITLGSQAPAAPGSVTVTSFPILGNPKGLASGPSNAEGVVAIMTAPGAPALVGGVEKIDVAWDPVPGAAFYELWYSSGDDSGSAGRFETTQTGSVASITGLANDTAYQVWVKAAKGTWTSDFSPPGTATTVRYAIQLYDGETKLSESSVLVLPAQAPGYAPAPSKTVTLRNTATGDTGALSLALSGANAENFMLSTTNIPSIAADGDDTFAVSPVIGLAAGVYTAALRVTGEDGLSAGFGLSFTVSAEQTVGSLAIVFEDAFPGEPELVVYGNVALNEAGEIPLVWNNTIRIQTGTVYYKTIWIDGEQAATLDRDISPWQFNPSGLAPGPHRVTVFFSDSEGGAFIAAAELQFRISR